MNLFNLHPYEPAPLDFESKGFLKELFAFLARHQLTLEALRHLAGNVPRVAPSDLSDCLVSVPAAEPVESFDSSVAGLGAYLATKIEEKGWSLRELARRSGVSVNAVYCLINGEIQSPGIQNLQAIAKALNVPLTALIDVYQGREPSE